MLQFVIAADLTSEGPIETCILKFGLHVSAKTTLKTIPGSQHWHLKSGTVPGVLEVTWDPQQSKIFVVIHDNRRADWNLAIAQAFANAIAEAANGHIQNQ